MILQSNPDLDLKTQDNDYVENEFLSFNMLKHQKIPTLQARKANFWSQIPMRVSALAVNTNDQCRTRGLERFFQRCDS